jgi:hypothetical protein
MVYPQCVAELELNLSKRYSRKTGLWEITASRDAPLGEVADNATLRALRDLPPASSIYQLRNEHEILDGDL